MSSKLKIGNRETALYAFLAIFGILILAFVIGHVREAKGQTLQSVTCEDVRRLTWIERWAWAKRLQLTEQEKQMIIQTCGLEQPRKDKDARK